MIFKSEERMLRVHAGMGTAAMAEKEAHSQRPPTPDDSSRIASRAHAPNARMTASLIALPGTRAPALVPAFTELHRPRSSPRSRFPRPMLPLLFNPPPPSSAALRLSILAFAFQEMLCEKTRVLVKRQKLVGLSVGGRPASDDCPLERIRLKTPHRFILMGTPEVGNLTGARYFFLLSKYKGEALPMRAFLVLSFIFMTAELPALSRPKFSSMGFFGAVAATCAVLYGCG